MGSCFPVQNIQISISKIRQNNKLLYHIEAPKCCKERLPGFFQCICSRYNRHPHLTKSSFSHRIKEKGVDYMDHRKARLYGIRGQIIGFGLIILAIVYMNTLWLYIFGTLGVLCSLAAIVVMFLFWRCPCCQKRLPRDNQIFEIIACPHCSANLCLAPVKEETADKG